MSADKSLHATNNLHEEGKTVGYTKLVHKIASYVQFRDDINLLGTAMFQVEKVSDI